MPLYEYRCDACGKRFELIQKFSDPTPETCKLCGQGPVHRLLSSPAIQFKGSGFYITDYVKKSGESASAAGKTSETKTEAGNSDSAKSDTAAAASPDSSTKSESTKAESTTSSAASTSTTKE